MMPRSVARASVVATPSEFVRGTVIDAFGIDAARVVVVPHGVRSTPIEHGVRAANRQADHADGRRSCAVRQRYGLGDGPYVVYPAITHPHKNHRLLLDVMARHWTDPTLRLVLLGGAGAADADVGRSIVDRGIGDRVVRPGRVPDADRDALIAGATALVFPSEYEGFGAPLVEAMAARHAGRVQRSPRPARGRRSGRDRAARRRRTPGRARSDEVGAAPRRARRRRTTNAPRHYTLAASGAALVDAYHRDAPLMRLVVLVPALRPRHGPDGARHEPHRRASSRHAVTSCTS